MLIPPTLCLDPEQVLERRVTFQINLPATAHRHLPYEYLILQKAERRSVAYLMVGQHF